MGTSNYPSEPVPGTYLSPKARINPTTPVATGLKPNSPVYKYVYGNKDGQQQQFSEPFFRKK